MTTTEHVAAESRGDPEWFEHWAEAAAARIATNAARAKAVRIATYAMHSERNGSDMQIVSAALLALVNES